METRDLSIEQFDYPLPEERIAKHPLAERDRCKLLLREHDGSISEHLFDELPALLPEDSLLIRNNTRVINARLRFRKGGDGAPIEIFCLEPESPSDYALSFAATGRCRWLCFVGNSKRWKQGELLMETRIGDREASLKALRIEKRGNSSVVEFSWEPSEMTFADIISAAGEIPIPPYLNRKTEAADSKDYQTVYSRIDGSVASPTAGLHFTKEIFDRIASRGIPCRELTLHVGAGTFQPVKSKTIGGHEMHSEYISVPRQLIAELAPGERRTIAVGTTSVRTLESLYHIGCMIYQGSWNGELPQWYPYAGDHPQLSTKEALNALLARLEAEGSDRLVASTRMIIMDGYRYRIVRGMVTNFHQPQSTLLLLVSAFTGGDWRRMYDYALEHGFRFLSYGDATLLL